MKIEEVIGQRMSEVREAAGVTQAAFGEMLEATLGRPWSRQSVSAAEKGRRAFTAVELVALADALEVPIIELLSPPMSVEHVELPTGAKVAARELYPSPGGAGAVLESLRRLEKHAAHRERIEAQERELVARLIARFDAEPPSDDETDEEKP